MFMAGGFMLVHIQIGGHCKHITKFLKWIHVMPVSAGKCGDQVLDLPRAGDNINGKEVALVQNVGRA